MEQKNSLNVKKYAKRTERLNKCQNRLNAYTSYLSINNSNIERKYQDKINLYIYRHQTATDTTALDAYKEKVNAKLQKAKTVHQQKTSKRIDRWTKKVADAKTKLAECIKNENYTLGDDVVLFVDNLSMHFGGLKAVNELTFTCYKNEIFGLIGPNGAGKTTVFNCITQFYNPTHGNILFRTKTNSVINLNNLAVHDVILQGIVRTFQNVEVIKECTVLENMLIAGTRLYSANLIEQMLHLPILNIEEQVINQRALKVLEFMGLTQYKDMIAFGLPYGIMKKIEIARTLMLEPQLIILDEPAAGLNDTETAELSRLIRRIRQEYDCTILLVEHDMGLIMDVCDKICAISFGKLLAYGSPTEIQSNVAVQEAYLGLDEEKSSAINE